MASVIDSIKAYFAKEQTRRTRQKKTIELVRQAESFTRNDIGAWRRAWMYAANIDNPDRRKLLDIYRDSMADNHLSGCIEQRTNMALAKSFKLVDAGGKPVGDATELLNAPWFKDFLRLSLESIYWGHSLIELGNPVDCNGKLEYDSVTLINRKHVIPEYGRVIKTEGDVWQSGIDYRNDPVYTPWLIEVGKPTDLGLLLKVSQQCISKRNILAFWDTFAEIFGMPLRIAKITSRDDNDKALAEDSLRKMGAAGYGVLSTDTDIEIVEAAKGDTYNVYDRRIDRANSEISKAIIGQTMTIEDGSSLSQSQTHLTVFNNIVESDCDMLRDVINCQLLPRMARHGFPVDELRFEWDYAIDYTPEQQIAYEQMLLNNFEIDPKYFIEKYGVPVGERRQMGGMMSKPYDGFFL